jgi:hypothetical protein
VPPVVPALTNQPSSRSAAAIRSPTDVPPLTGKTYQILDTTPDGAFEGITSLAARLFYVPISIREHHR